jgi:hypothetical protein
MPVDYKQFVMLAVTELGAFALKSIPEFFFKIFVSFHI